MRGWSVVPVVRWCVLLLAFMAPTPAAAQDPLAGGAGALNLFFDCQAPGCRDLDFFRREAPFVNWVLDREVADVHVLVTSQRTGGGGQFYTLAFIGLGDFEGEEQELSHATAGDATVDDQRSGVAQKLKLGLVRYVQNTPAADQLRVVFGDVTGRVGPGGGPPAGPEAATPDDDPWDFWVFRVGGNLFMNGQATFSQYNLFTNVNASRTSEAWKLSIGGNYQQRVQHFEFPNAEGGVTEIDETLTSWGTQGLAVRSIGGQWALGVKGEVGGSSFLNQDFRLSVKPGVEFNFFPYAESSRRSFTLQYLAGPAHFDYEEPTIFQKESETMLQHSLTGRLSLVQPWGRWETSLDGSQYLHDTSKYRVTLFGNVNVRLFRGFSVRMSGNYSWIRDQLFLPAGEVTEEQILLFQRQLETDFQYFTSIGIEYRFGSIFNNVVNPRFGSSGNFF